MELTDKYPVNIENGIAVLGDDLEMFKMINYIIIQLIIRVIMILSN